MMQRRDFLKAASAACVATGGMSAIAAAAANGGRLQIARLASDRFQMQLDSSEPRSLRILQLTDTHFGTPTPDARLKDQRSFDELGRLVAAQRPDFIVHTGDFINNDKGHQVSFEAIEVLDSWGIPWTHALGNHDIGARSVPEFRRPMQRAAVGEFRDDAGEHYSFRFDVLAAGDDRPKWSLFCFDSGFKEPHRKVSAAQLRWFARQMAADARVGLRTPCLAFIHIPVIEFESLRAAGKSVGNFGEDVCYDSDRGATFAELERSGRVRAIFSGHDHKNDYAGIWRQIELVYGRVGGWSAYGELPRGGRLIEVDLAAATYVHRLVFPPA